MTGSNPNGRSQSFVQQPQSEHRNGSDMPPKRTGKELPVEREFQDRARLARKVMDSGGHLKVLGTLWLCTLLGMHLLGGTADPVWVGNWPLEVGTEQSRVQCVTVSGARAYVGRDRALHVVDVSDPALPQEIGTTTTFGTPVRITLSGHYAYVAAGAAGLRLFDVSDPSNPQSVGVYYAFGMVTDVVARNEYAYLTVAGDPMIPGEGLVVLDVSDPRNPLRVGGHGTGAYSNAIVVQGRHAYVAAGDAGLLTIDISDPTRPQQISADTSFAAVDVELSDSYAYAVGARPEGASWVSTLVILDLRNPAQPRRIGRYDCPGEPRGVTVSGKFAYVACGTAGLEILDMTQVADPRRIGWYDTAGATLRTAVENDRIFLADWLGGLVILEMPPLSLSFSRDVPNLLFWLKGYGPVRLQRADSLDNPDWLDLANMDESDTIPVPTTGKAGFFRVVRP